MAALITIAELKELVTVREGVTKFDAKLGMAIVTATTMIENACRRSFTKSERIETFAPANTYDVGIDLFGTSLTGHSAYVRPQRIALSGLMVDVAEPLDVRYDALGAFGDDTVIAADNYTLNAKRGIIDLRYPTRHVTGALRVRYTAGWASDNDPTFPTISATAPDELKMACRLQAMFIWNRLDPNTLGMSSDDDSRSSNNRFVISGGVIPDVAVLIAPYRRVLTGGA